MYYRIETDIVSIGGGFMGLSLAHQAALAGIRTIVLENHKIKGPHYMTGFVAPRADYLPYDIESVEKTAMECARWRKMFPEVIRPKFFLLPISKNTPYGFDMFKALFELYDRKTPGRMKLLPQGHYRINQAILEKMEPNLRKGYFTEAIGFYELTAEPNALLQALMHRNDTFYGQYYRDISMKCIAAYVMEKGLIKELHIATNGGDHIAITNNRGPLIVINAAGPWMAEAAKGLAIKLPIEFSLGIQLSVSRKYCIDTNIITFTKEGKYMALVQKRDHLQIGPSNTPFQGNPDILGGSKEDIDILVDTYEEIMEPENIKYPVAVKSAGLRVKLKLPYCPDTNRALIFQTGYENYFAVYPGKTAMALATADELINENIKPLLGKVAIPGIGNGKAGRHALYGNQKYRNIIKLNIAYLKSMLRLIIHTAIYFLKWPIKPRP